MKETQDANLPLLEAIDALATARAKERIAIFVENAEGAAYHSATATKARQLIKDILDMKDRTLVTTIVKTQNDDPINN